MDPKTRALARKAIEAADGRARKMVLDGKGALFNKYSPHGLFHASILIKGAIRLFEIETETLIVKITDEVSVISKETEAFAMIADCLLRFDRFLVAEFDSVIQKGCGNKVGSSSDARSGKALFAGAQASWRRQLEMHRFSFIGQPITGSLALAKASMIAPIPTKNPGGKPLAAHWDSLWADIAFQLWNGDLQPTKQADITKAMFAWLTANGIDAGQTAVTERARAIWQKIEAKRLS